MKLKLASSLAAGAAKLSKFLKYYQWIFTGKSNEIEALTTGYGYKNYGTEDGLETLIGNVQVATVDTDTIFRSDYDMDLYNITIIDFVGTAVMVIDGTNFVFTTGGTVDNFELSNGYKFWSKC